jgi:hypothetical protein
VHHQQDRPRPLRRPVLQDLRSRLLRLVQQSLQHRQEDGLADHSMVGLLSEPKQAHQVAQQNTLL